MKKKSANWYIAATHLLTAGLVVPFLIGIILALLAYIWVSSTHIILTQVQFQISIIIIYPVMMFLGSMYSARYINKHYIVSNNVSIANLSVIYLIVLGVLYRLPILLKGFSYGLALNALAFIIGVGVFYWASKKYIVTTPA